MLALKLKRYLLQTPAPKTTVFSYLPKKPERYLLPEGERKRYLPKVERKVLAGSVAATDYFESTVGPHTVGQAMKRSCLQRNERRMTEA